MKTAISTVSTVHSLAVMSAELTVTMEVTVVVTATVTATVTPSNFICSAIVHWLLVVINSVALPLYYGRTLITVHSLLVVINSVAAVCTCSMQTLW